MSPIQAPARRRTARAGRLAAAVAGLAVLATGAAAQTAAAVTNPALARAAAARAASAPAPIPINKANWSGSAGSNSRSPAWYTDRSGVVHLQGAATQTSTAGTDPSLIGTLPPAARPTTEISTVVHTFLGTFSGVLIGKDGTIRAPGAYDPAVTDLSFVSLEGITYRPAGAGSSIGLNATNWVPSGGDFRPPAWFKDGSGVVHLQGAATQFATTGSTPNLIGTLPPAARPANTVYTIVCAGQLGYADLAIEPNGTLDIIDPRPPAAKDYAIVSLESISYRPAGNGTAIPLNLQDWNGLAGSGSRPPTFYRDRSGVVHLQGAVSQFTASGTQPNVIGTLPSTIAPRHTVYTIVHTNLGTYADLAIESNGELALIDPRPPMVKDYSFVSLESITYRR
jgi:hypothetical protein